jgi:hypothetical protein
MVSRPFLQKSAIAISIASLLYNVAEGIISVVFGAESSSHSLIFFGIQSVIEVLSASLVVWRFMNGLKAGEESDDGCETRMSKDLRFVYFPLCPSSFADIQQDRENCYIGHRDSPRNAYPSSRGYIHRLSHRP